jgi:hypothetical protein
MATSAVKFGTLVLGLGLLSFLVLFVATGGIGPCASTGQMLLLILGLVGTGIGGLVLLFSLPIVLVRKYKAQREPNSFQTH